MSILAAPPHTFIARRWLSSRHTTLRQTCRGLRLNSTTTCIADHPTSAVLLAIHLCTSQTPPTAPSFRTTGLLASTKSKTTGASSKAGRRKARPWSIQTARCAGERTTTNSNNLCGLWHCVRFHFRSRTESPHEHAKASSLPRPCTHRRVQCSDCVVCVTQSMLHVSFHPIHCLDSSDVPHMQSAAAWRPCLPEMYAPYCTHTVA